MKYEIGEYIPLRWDYCDDEFHAVKGWVSLETFNQAYEAETEDANFHSVIEHVYGRWSMETGEDGPSLVLQPYFNPGRGRFHLTVAWSSPEARLRCLSVKELHDV